MTYQLETDIYMKSKNKIQVYVADQTKEALVKVAENKGTSVSHVAERILSEAMQPTTTKK